MPDSKTARYKTCIEKYQQKIFALVLYLIGGDQNNAYDITAQSFADAIQSVPELEKENIILLKLAASAIEKSRLAKIIPFSDAPDFIGISREKRKSLELTRASLQALSFDLKALLLLRDQLHFSYKDIALVLGISQQKAKIDLTRARVQLREQIKEVLGGAK